MTPFRTRSFFCFLIFFGAAAGPLYAANEASLVNRGNKLYNEGKYDEALKKYEEAEALRPDSEKISFDKGAALYKKRETEKAREEFSKALISEDEALEAKANYNMGNIKYKEAVQNRDTKEGTAKRLYNESLDYYKRAIELDEKDEDAKYNYEFVKKELKAFLAKQEEKREKEQQKQESKEGQEQQDQQQQNQQQQNQQQQQQSEQQKNQEQQQKERQEEQRQESQQPQQEKEEEQKESEAPSGGSEESQEEKSEKSGQAARPEEEQNQISEQEARMLLEGYGQQEEPKVELNKRRTDYEVLKDW